jgi:hypothetical protein
VIAAMLATVAKMRRMVYSSTVRWLCSGRAAGSGSCPDGRGASRSAFASPGRRRGRPERAGCDYA